MMKHSKDIFMIMLFYNICYFVNANAAVLVVSDPIVQKSLSSSLKNDTQEIDATRDVEYQASWIRTALYGKHTFSQDIKGDINRYRDILADAENIIEKNNTENETAKNIPANYNESALEDWQKLQQKRRLVMNYSRNLLQEAEKSVDHLDVLAKRNDDASTIKQSQGMTNRLLLELLKQLQAQSTQIAVMQQLAIAEKPVNKISVSNSIATKSALSDNLQIDSNNCDNYISNIFSCDDIKKSNAEEIW